MSKFVKSEFSAGEYVTYGNRFVARFKRGGRGSFLTFLVKNFTVEEYFAELDRGVAPLQILESRGYISPNVGKILIAAGFPATTAGKRQYLDQLVRQV